MMMKSFAISRLLISALLAGFVASQNSTTTPSPNATPSLSLSLTTSTSISLTTTRGRVSSVPIPTTFNVTYTITPTPTTTSSSTQASAVDSASPTPTPIVLDTKLDPAFGVLGAILILTGLPSAFWGHKNRWTSFFLIGFYTLSLVCIVLILKFGVLPSVNPPGNTLRGMFVLASGVSGMIGGGIAIFFWKGAKFFIGAWGGFAVGLFIQCFRDGGLIQSDGLRWILYIGCAVVGFILCTIPKIHYHVLLVSTAFVGATAFMLGVDCFSTAGLKEFYVWNLGFSSLFPKFTTNGIKYPVSQTMQIELGLMGAVALMGIAVQLRVLKVLQRKLKEIQAEQKRRDEDAEAQAAERFTGVMLERDQWERDHPTLSDNKHGRHESGYSSTPLMKDQEGNFHSTPEPISSTFTLVNDGRPRYQSGVSDFLPAPVSDEDANRAARQTAGALPALDLGLGIQDDVPRNFIAEASSAPRTTDPEEIQRQALLTEIQTIRRSIDALKSETPAPSTSSDSRRLSMTSRRTLSIDAHSALLPSPAHLRPPRENDPRNRVQSLELSHLAHGEAIGRPTSAPLRDNDWDSYLHDRKLVQPPSGISPPIAVYNNSPNSSSPRMPIPNAVTEALSQRKRREAELIDAGKDSSSDDVPLAAQLQKHNSTSGNHIPPIIPSRKPIAAPTPQKAAPVRARTFEELDQRHRKKMKDLQAPLSQAERETAEIEAAKQRWEKAKAVEKEAVTRRQAEKAATLEKKRQSGLEPAEKSNVMSRHSRSLSADKLGGSSSKRLSSMKVQDWQKQQESGAADKRRPDEMGVPFPEDKEKARDRSSRRLDRRDPPS